MGSRNTGGSHRSDGSYAGRRQLEDRQLQAVQLQGIGRIAERWCSASAEQGERRISKDLLQLGLH